MVFLSRDGIYEFRKQGTLKKMKESGKTWDEVKMEEYEYFMKKFEEYKKEQERNTANDR